MNTLMLNTNVNGKPGRTWAFVDIDRMVLTIGERDSSETKSIRAVQMALHATESPEHDSEVAVTDITPSRKNDDVYQTIMAKIPGQEAIIPIQIDWEDADKIQEIIEKMDTPPTPHQKAWTVRWMTETRKAEDMLLAAISIEDLYHLLKEKDRKDGKMGILYAAAGAVGGALLSFLFTFLFTLIT